MKELYNKLEIIHDNIEVVNFTIEALRAKDIEDASLIILSSVVSQMTTATHLLENNIRKMVKNHEKTKEEHANLLKQYNGVLFDVEAKHRGYVKAD